MKIEHGTRQRYRKGCRCLDCKRANRDYQRSYIAERRADVPHGTQDGYGNHGCRCDDCRDAHSRDLKRRRREAKQRRKLRR